MRRARAALVLAGAAWIGSVAGGGAIAPIPLAIFEVLVVIAALTAAAAPGPPVDTAVARLGVATCASGLAAAILAPWPFASVDRWAAWSCCLLLAWTVSRGLRAIGGATAGSSLVLVVSTMTLLFQTLGHLGLPLGGQSAEVEPLRPLGTFSDPNQLSALLVLVVVAQLGRAGWRDARGRVHLCLAILAGAAVVASGSRIAPVALLGALLGFAGALWMASGRRPRWSWLLAATGAVVVLGGVTAWTVADRFTEKDAWTRPRIWRAVAPAVLERPVLGIGPGSFRHAHHQYNFPVETRVGRYAKAPTSAHGEWLRLPIELGLLGTSLLLALAVAVARAGPRGSWLPWAGAAVPLALVHDVLQSPALASWLAVLAVLPTARRSVEGAKARQLLGPDAPVLLPLAVAVTVAVSGLVIRPTLAHVLADRAGDARALESALRLNPRQPSTWARLALRAAPPGVALEPARLAIAEQALSEARLAAPRLPVTALQRARLLARAARAVPTEDAVRAAVRAYDHAAELAPTEPFSRAEAAAFLLSFARPAEALPRAEAALELEPRFVDAQLLRALALHALGREGRAREAASAALRAPGRLDDLLPYERKLLRPRPELLDRLRAAGLTDS